MHYYGGGPKCACATSQDVSTSCPHSASTECHNRTPHFVGLLGGRQTPYKQSLQCQRHNQHWLDIAHVPGAISLVTAMMGTSTGMTVVLFLVILINPPFVTSYNQGEDVWVISNHLFLTLIAGIHAVLFLGWNLDAIVLMINSLDKIHWQVPWIRPVILQTSCIVCVRSSRMASRTFAMFSGIVPVDGCLEQLSFSIEDRQFLKCLCQL